MVKIALPNFLYCSLQGVLMKPQMFIRIQRYRYFVQLVGHLEERSSSKDQYMPTLPT